MSLAFANELFEMLTLCLGETDDILLVHGETPVSLAPMRLHACALLLNQTVTED